MVAQCLESQRHSRHVDVHVREGLQSPEGSSHGKQAFCQSSAERLCLADENHSCFFGNGICSWFCDALSPLMTTCKKISYIKACGVFQVNACWVLK